MSVKTDVVNLVVTINGDTAKKKFYELQATAAGLRAEMNGLKRGTDEWIAKSKELTIVEKNIAEVRKEVKLTDLSIKDLRKEIARLKNNRDSLDPLSEAFKDLDSQVKKAEGRLRDLNQGTGFLAKSFNFLKSEAASFGMLALGALGIDFLIGKFQGLIQTQAELSDSFAQIRRTTGLSQTAVEDLNKSLSKIDTRTAKKDLRDIAIVLGQIGEPATVESIRAIDKIVVALGDEFQGGADEISTALSILRNNFTTFKTQDYAGDIEQIGNALSVLGKSGIATAPVVTDMATRMSGVLGTFKVTAGQTLGLSAAMQEMGITVERGSTAVTKLVQKMAQNPEIFAKVAGAKTQKEIQDFVELLNTDAVSALLKVAEGSKAAGNSNVEFAAILKELESTGAGVSEVLAKFAANGELVKEKVDLASEAILKTDTIQNSFAISNENLAAKVAKLQKQFASLWESQAVTNFLKKAVDGAFNFIEALKNLGGWLERNAFWIKGLVVAYAAYYVAMGRLITVQTIQLALTKARTAAMLLENFAVNAIVFSLRLLTGEITVATAATRLWTAALAVNPIILISSAIAGLTYGLSGYIQKLEDAKYAQDAFLNSKKLEADLKLRSDTFKAENASILKDIEEGNTAKIKMDMDALEVANSIRQQEIQQAKAVVAEKQKIAEAETRFAKAMGTSGWITKGEAERERDKQILADAEKNLADLEDKQLKYVDLRKSAQEKLKDIDQKQAASAKELSDAEKKAMDDRRKALEAYRKELEAYSKRVEQAKIDLIEEDKAREIASLDFKHKLDVQEIQAQAQKLAAEAKALGKSTEEQNKIISDAAFIKLQSEEEYQRQRTAIIEKYADALKKGNYNNEIKDLNDNLAVQKLMYDQLYADQVIDKNVHDTQIANAERRSKAELLSIAQRYGIDVTKVQQDIANDDIKVLEDKIERAKRLLQREADFRVALAQYNQQNNPDSASAAEELMRAQLNQLQVQMENEIDLHVGHEEEILQIKAEYNLKKEQLDKDFEQAERARKGSLATEYIDIFNNAANQIFAFRQSQLQNEVQEVQQKLRNEDEKTEQSYKNKLLSDVEYQNKKKVNREKQEKAEREAKRKQAILDKAQALFNIALSTAQALIQLWVNPGFPTAIPMAAGVAGLGALEAAFVASQKIPQAYTGGYRKVKGAQDGRDYSAQMMPGFEQGYLSNPALVLAGERGPEYFVNNTALQNPTVKHVVDGIEALTRGKINTVDFQSMLAMPALQQRYTGGYVGQSTTASGEMKGASGSDMLFMIAAAVNRLNDHLDAGIKADAKIGDKAIVDLEERKTYLKAIETNAN